MNSRKRRRSIYVSKDINKDEIFTKDNNNVICPGYGLKPKYMDEILGEKSKSDMAMGTHIPEVIFNLIYLMCKLLLNRYDHKL